MTNADGATTAAIAPLWAALDKKVLPWACEQDSSRCIIAPPTWQDLRKEKVALPDSVTATPRPQHGERVRVSKARQRVGSTMALYHWPSDGLLTKREPQLACILSGRSDFRISDYVIHVPEGHFIVVPPGVPYPDGSRGHLDGNGSCDILWLTQYAGVLRCWMCHSRNQEHPAAAACESCFVQDPKIYAYLSALSEEATDREHGYEHVCRSLLSVLWTLLHRRIGRGQFFQDNRFAPGEQLSLTATGTPIALAQQYIRSHLHEHLTMAGVAQRVYLSRSLFARLFTQETGLTFTAFVTQCRVESARKLLLETQWPLTTISETTGITPEHLRAIFLRHTGQTPQEFRLTQRANTRNSGR
jgi:AraC-like DNA-binding protein